MTAPSLRPGSGCAAPGAWDVERVVGELRAARASYDESLLARRARHDLPSRDAIVEVAASLRAALFPTHFGPQDLTDERVDYFVGYTLGATLAALYEQARRELRLASPVDRPGDELDQDAGARTRAFAARLPAVRALLETDVRAAFEGDPAAKSPDEALFCYPGVTAITYHRLAHELYGLELPLLARILSEVSHGATGVDIHPGAKIGSSFFIDHGTGVVIGETSVLGERVRLYQGVTLGAKSFPLDPDGKPIKGVARHPIVEDDVVIYAGATILGRVTIGRGSSIGGNVWLTHSVPAGSKIAQTQP